MFLLCLGGERPLGVDRRVATRIQHAVAGIAHLETVEATIDRVEIALGPPRPRQGFVYDAVDGKELLALAAGVVVVDTQRAFRLRA